jgi:gliding motility-associated-like protein
MATPTETTTYTVTGTDSIGCQVEQQVTVYVSSPPTVEAGTDVISYIDDPAQLMAVVPEGYTIVWSPTEGLSCTDCPDPVADPLDVTTYYVSITDELGCISIDSVVVYVDPTLYIPNAFTPGPDAFNPIFYVYGRGIQDFELSIFTRWGQCIYMSTEMDSGWDGTFNGSPAQQGVYVYQVNFTSVLQPGRLQQRMGHVTLLRNMDE